jgi:hypothetical protein
MKQPLPRNDGGLGALFVASKPMYNETGHKLNKAGNYRGRVRGSKNHMPIEKAPPKNEVLVVRDASWTFTIIPKVENNVPTVQVDVRYSGEGGMKKA